MANQLSVNRLVQTLAEILSDKYNLAVSIEATAKQEHQVMDEEASA